MENRRLSISTTLTDPDMRGDMWVAAIQCYSELADEVVIVDGSKHEKMRELPDNCKIIKYEWPDEFDWPFIGQQFTRGYEHCTGDWVIHLDSDMFFKETDYGLLRRLLLEDEQTDAYSFWKYQFILPDRYNLKSRLVLAINKRKLGNRVKFDSGGDLCRPSIDGVEINPDKAKESRVAIYNYEKMLKTINQVYDDVGRMARAWQKHYGSYKLGGPDNESAFNEWATMVKGRFYNKEQKIIPIKDHPMYVIPFIVNLKKEQFGYEGFGILERNSYVKSSRSLG